MKGSGLLLAAALLVVVGAAAAAETEYRAAVLRVDVPNRPLPISRLDAPPADLGFAGRGAGDGGQRHHRRLHAAEVQPPRR